MIWEWALCFQSLCQAKPANCWVELHTELSRHVMISTHFHIQIQYFSTVELPHFPVHFSYSLQNLDTKCYMFVMLMNCFKIQLFFDYVGYNCCQIIIANWALCVGLSGWPWENNCSHAVHIPMQAVWRTFNWQIFLRKEEVNKPLLYILTKYPMLPAKCHIDAVY